MERRLRLFFGVHASKVHGAGHLMENQKYLTSFELLYCTVLELVV